MILVMPVRADMDPPSLIWTSPTKLSFKHRLYHIW